MFGHKRLLPFQNGILFSNKSLLDLKCNLIDTYKMKYLLTTKLIRHPWEFFFVLKAWGACMITQMHLNLCTASDGTSRKDIQQRLCRWILTLYLIPTRVWQLGLALLVYPPNTLRKPKNAQPLSFLVHLLTTNHYNLNVMKIICTVDFYGSSLVVNKNPHRCNERRKFMLYYWIRSF